MTTQNFHFNPPYYGCSNVILAVATVYIHVYICVEIAKVQCSLRAISRICRLLYGGENQRYVRMDILCKYEKQSTKLAIKQIYT
ncbi:hypothetical protein ALC62_07739 [Cyphomyrmex costatus]|uniref:Uncharacterized protein n=1 Tax=Cyphomyrmex costatus TaxID=456900 RepID=A0A195CM61_9HYME|nr:hypothetical protein ALC62_07739 [Cyphomyrmex costatus]